MLDTAGQLAAAQIALYALLILPSIYTVWKHSWQGLLGWGFLVAFCSLRLIGSALQVSNEKNGTTSETTQIIGGVGLSPLVLAFIGLLHEVNHYLRGSKSFLLRWPISVGLHLVVLAALALVVVGVKDGKSIGKVGYILFVIVWIAIIALTAVSWRQVHTSVEAKHVLIAVTVTLPLLGVRILYSCIASFDSKINAYSGPIAYRIVLSVLMELLIVIILAAFGVMTRRIRRQDQTSTVVTKEVSHESV